MKIWSRIGVGQGFQNGVGVMSSGVSRFLLLLAYEGAYVIHSELGTDQWSVAPGNRAFRCTGVVVLLQIVSKNLLDPLRSHKDIMFWTWD
ncbi:hypothetical protein Tco_0747811 [Tanacetum coccineum]|uniref:Uncharacterized protein n=1 Tax=Tanacetum coccineum TaxID=301880 RepID=A0ABQ4YU37_9ASTR